MTPADLMAAAEAFGTPAYVYDLDAVQARLDVLEDLFGAEFGVSYAIKANPNAALLRSLAPRLSTFDASSYAEVERALAAGMPAARITFSGPAKRPGEISRAIDVGVGELVVETIEEALRASAHAAAHGRVQAILVRINPLKVPRGFGASMAGTPSQFGIDEEEMATALPEIQTLPGLDLIGFHIYSGTNSRDAAVIAANFEIFAAIFRAAQAITGIAPRRLVFGSGFGIPYLPGETPLDHVELAGLVRPIVAALLGEVAFRNARCNLELGRWLVGPAGWLLTGVISGKRSRGVEIRACDAGFNNHLAACGMMGSVIRRNWVYDNVSNPDGAVARYTLVGPLCTTIDRLAMDIELPQVRVGDVLAIAASGAYGLTASPTRFISHPEPREVVVEKGALREATETLLNHWPDQEDASRGGTPREVAADLKSREVAANLKTREVAR